MSNLQVIHLKDLIISRNSLYLDRINWVSIDWDKNSFKLEYEKAFLSIEECIHITTPISNFHLDPSADYIVVIHELWIETSESIHTVFQGYFHERLKRSLIHFLSLWAKKEFEEVEDEFWRYDLIEGLSIYSSRVSGKILSLNAFMNDLRELRLIEEAIELEAFLSGSATN